jgi:hypothetical protein
MAKFFIEIPHGEDKVDCLKAIKILEEWGSHFITRAEYGCFDGDHTARMFIEVDNREEAINVIPRAYRNNAKVVMVRRFSVEKIDEWLSQSDK